MMSQAQNVYLKHVTVNDLIRNEKFKDYFTLAILIELTVPGGTYNPCASGKGISLFS